MSKPAAFRAEFSDWKLIRTRKVVQIVFEVPVEQADEAYAVLGGMPDPSKSVWCAVARLKEGGDAAEQDQRRRTDTSPAPIVPHSGRAKVPFDQMSPAQQAGILCADKAFQRFLAEDLNASVFLFDEAAAAGEVRARCHVRSRSEITRDNQHWQMLIGAYRHWQHHPEFA